MCLRSWILTSGRFAFFLAVFQELKMETYGFFVFGEAKRYLLCLGMVSSSSWSAGVIGGILFLPFLVMGIVQRLLSVLVTKECLISFF